MLLVRAARGASSRGRWLLPGGGVRHGEHPAHTVVREVDEETGLRVAVVGVRDVLTDVSHLTDIATLRHQDRIVFDVRLVGGELRPEAGGSSDEVAWVRPAELDGLPLMPYVGRLLGVGTTAEPTRPEIVPWQSAVPPGARRHQRFAAYGLATDPAGRVLLTLISSDYPGAGRWHLPGGGTDFGETPATGLLREIVEESGQHGRLTGLLGVSHRHNPRAFGREGYPIDWHTVRVVYRVVVDEPTPPVVHDNGGSTADAAWFTVDEIDHRSLTEVAAAVLADLGLAAGTTPRD